LSAQTRLLDGVVTMKILDLLRRNKVEQKPPLPPIRTIRTPGEVRAEHQARRAKEFEDTGIFETDIGAADAFMDTGSMELENESGESENPYETHSWEMDPDEGLRRVDDQNRVNRKKPEGTADNPYDTIIKKKGW